MKKVHFFDHNATTPLCPAAREAWLRACESHWLNPSSPYRAAAAVKVRFDELREELGCYLGVEPGRLVFNSGATEGNNGVLRHWAAVLGEDARIGISPVEHPSVLEPAKQLFGGRIDWLPVGEDGQVCLDRLDLSGLSAVTMQAANNETGRLQPWERLSGLCRARGIPFHCDASQWIGKMAPGGLGDCDYITGCAHKFCGPRGVGFLVVPESLQLSGGLLGGAQQAGRRAGTEDLAGAAAMLAALQEVERKRPDCGPAGKSAFRGHLQACLPEAAPVGGPDGALWNTLALVLPEFSSARWIRALEKRGFLVSAGSACSTGHAGPSHVLAAMGVSPEAASRVIRISSGWETSVEDWTALAEATCEAYQELRQDNAGNRTRVISI